MTKQIGFSPSIDLSFLEVWFWSSFFVGCSHFCGVPKTIRVIQHLAQALPLQEGDIDFFSQKVDLVLRRLFPFLFLARKQNCLTRGFLLYFYGKRLGQDICLRFGSQFDHGKLKTHCWILEQGVIRFEVEEVIRDYVVLIEYS